MLTNFTVVVGPVAADLVGLSTISTIQSRLILTAILALASHHLIFINGEWHLQAPFLFTMWLWSHPLLFLGELILGANTVGVSASNAVLTLSCFTTVLFTSMAVYRLFFHRLRNFPGPKLAKVSKLWHFTKCWDGRNHHVLETLREQYGDFVRTGPSEITIFSPEALIRMDGPGNQNIKSDWYDFLMPDMGVTTLRDRQFHDQRRRVWTQAFSAKALPSYEQGIVDHVRKVNDLIQAAAMQGTSVDFSSISYWFAFDVMGIFTLSQSFNMLHDKKWHHVIRNVRRAMSFLGPFGSVPWLAQIGLRFLKGYWIVKDWHCLTQWCRDRMQDRINMDDDNINVANYLISDARKKGYLDNRHLLAGETIVAIVAGSDTVAPTIVFLFYELALNPSMADELYRELKGVDIHNFRALEKLPYLNALINETMRVHPVVLTGGLRDSPPEGIMIEGHYIPGNITIAAPRYTIFRSEICYQEADKFIPERWTTRPEMIKDGRSFLPFAQGRYTCLGKGIALSELRMLAAVLVSNYHIRFPPGDEGIFVEKDLRDQFTANPGKLKLVFVPRTS